MSDFLDTLNDGQRKAVCHDSGGLLVLAGAGTGKTRVLTHRCAWLMRERNCSPRDILAVTFTNKAAKEMRERIAGIVPFGANELAIGTFHGMCHRMLRRHAEAAGWDKNFQILDSQDQKNFISRFFPQNDFYVKEKKFSYRYLLNDFKEKGLRAADIVADDLISPHFIGNYKLYEDACRHENKMDFSELLLSAVDLLRNNKDLRHHYAERFRHILIDEMQDTNPMQYAWLKLLDSGDNNYFAVGDDDQSVYAFRGADPSNMRNMQSELRVTQIARLEENYRSTGNILNAANALIAKNSNRLGKNLFTRGGGGTLIRVTRYYSDADEASSVAASVRDLIYQGENAGDIAILYRTNAQGVMLKKTLDENKIPGHVSGGKKFYERQEIKHVLAYLHLAFVDDNDALRRVINMPPRGIGKRTIELLAQHGSIAEGIQKSDHPKVTAFRLMLEKWRAMLSDSNGDEILPLLAHAVVQESGMLEYYESRSKEQERERANSLYQFVTKAEQFKKDNEDDDALSAFLTNAVLESGGSEGNHDKAAVNLMTVHAAKGLEFSIVFVTGLEEGVFPSSQSLDFKDVANEEEEERRLIKEEEKQRLIKEQEEERRLMYVAITRAKVKLFLSHADSRMVFGITQKLPRSRFIEELPSALLDSVEERNVFYDDGAYRSPAKARGASSFPYTKKAAKKVKYPSPKREKEIKPPPIHGNIAEDNHPQYRLGVWVNHQKHGNGILLAREGRGDDLKVTVTFKTVGIKTFVLTQAPLSLV